MRTRTRHAIFQPSVLAIAIAVGCVAPVQAITFNIGEVEAQFDSSLSVGASWSVRGADPDFIGTRNGGKASSQTNDDGRLNFKKGETFSKIFKGIHDLELKYGDTGVLFAASIGTTSRPRTKAVCCMTSTTTTARRRHRPPARKFSMPSSITTTTWAACRAVCGLVSKWSAGVRVLLSVTRSTRSTPWMLQRSAGLARRSRKD